MEKTINEKIAEALLVIRPNAQWSLSGDDYSNLQWLDNEQSAPSWEEVKAEIDNPTPRPELTIQEKLAIAGISFDELKAALGGN